VKGEVPFNDSAAIYAEEFDKAMHRDDLMARIENAGFGTVGGCADTPRLDGAPLPKRAEKTPPERGFRQVGGTGLEPVTPSLSSWCSPN
jgi:hypothetical protein